WHEPPNRDVALPKESPRHPRKDQGLRGDYRCCSYESLREPVGGVSRHCCSPTPLTFQSTHVDERALHPELRSWGTRRDVTRDHRLAVQTRPLVLQRVVCAPNRDATSRDAHVESTSPEKLQH